MAHCELFVVRIWPQIAGGFRASVRRVDEDETRPFSRTDEVTRYLTTAAVADAGMGDAASLGRVPRDDGNARVTTVSTDRRGP